MCTPNNIDMTVMTKYKQCEIPCVLEPLSQLMDDLFNDSTIT